VLGDLTLGELDLDSDFLALGGHSITAMRLAALLRTDGWQVSPRDVVTQRTPRRIAAAAVRTDEGAEPPSEAFDRLKPDGGPAPDDNPQELVTIPDPVVWLERTGPDRPRAFVHPGGGGVHWY